MQEIMRLMTDAMPAHIPTAVSKTQPHETEPNRLMHASALKLGSVDFEKLDLCTCRNPQAYDRLLM